MKLEELIKVSEGVAIAVVPETLEDGKDWNVYIVNTKENEIKNVLITSKGYGEIDNKKLKTSTLRWFYESIPATSYAMVEPIMEEVFGLSNEYWVSYYINDSVFDKKFVFLPETIQDANLVTIPVINKKGVLIK